MSRFNVQEYNESVQEYIGVQVWWEINKISVPIERIQKLLVDVGLDPSLIDDEISNKVALKRAGRALAHRRKEGDTVQTKMSRPIVDNKQATIIGIVSEEVNEESLNYETTTTARLDKATGILVVSGKSQRALKENYTRFKANITDDDIRSMCKLVVERSGGVAFKRNGGNYFVPKLKVGVMAKLETFIDKLGCGKLQIMRVCNATTEKEITWESVEEDILKKVEKITFAVGNIEKRMPFVTKQQYRLEQVQKMVNYYVDLCGSESIAQSLTAKLQEAQKLVTEKIQEIEKIVKE